MSTFKQLVKEFFGPIIAALLWTVYMLYEGSMPWSIKNFITILGPSFFFASWLAAQYFRVRKQKSVELGLTTIEKNIKETLIQLEKTADHLAGQITGGSSICYIMGSTIEGNIFKESVAIHVGDHPLYDVAARIFDLDEAKAGNMTYHPSSRSVFGALYNIGNLPPNLVARLPIEISLGEGNTKSFNIFFSARNGTFTELLRCKKINGKWLFAIQVDFNGEIKFEKIDEGYLQEGLVMDWNS